VAELESYYGRHRKVAKWVLAALLLHRQHPRFSSTRPTSPITGVSTNNTQNPLYFDRANDKEWKMPQYTVNVSTTLSNNGNTSDVWNNGDTITDDRSLLLTWLSPLNPGLRHWDIQERCANGVGEWLLETEEIRRWYAGSESGEGESAVLFCYGGPGVGKTFIR